MYDVRQFRPVLYFLLCLGFSGFCLAAQSPGLWVIAIAGVLFNAWLIRRGWFFPMPRMIANLVTLAALLYIVVEVRFSGLAPILVIGQFLVLLQLVKLYEQRANRDYAQLLILSLLLVVAASINTASLLFGILLIVYLFLSLYCCLLFHLKVESDHAKAAIALLEEKLNPASLRHDQRYLSRSMRRLTLFVSFVAIFMAVIVFLFFPRGTGANLLAPLQQRASQTLTGFSDNVSFQNIARISQNNEVVAHVRIWHTLNEDGRKIERPVAGTQTILFRGTTLNVYHGGEASASATWQWERSTNEQPTEPGGDQMDYFGESNQVYPEQWRQEVWLSPTGTNVIFALPGPVAIKTDRDLPRIRYFNDDEVLQLSDPLSQPAHYEVISRMGLDFRNRPLARAPVLPQNARRGGGGGGGGGGFFQSARERLRWAIPENQPADSENPSTAHTDPALLAQFREFANRPEVSGSDANGALAPRRMPSGALDSEIAGNIANYLKSNFSYTLDLTDTRKLNDGRDPLLAFLNDWKKGHCEYFAGAMALLCQSLGMDARMVVGFKCDEYNATPGADYYIVRQSHAHAWVEVRTPSGWEIFDPTSAREATTIQQAGLWQKFKHLMDYLEYTWANRVVAYDRDDQGNLVKNTEARLTNIGIRGSQSAADGKTWVKESFSNWLKSWFTETNFFIVSSKIISVLIYLAILCAFVAIGRFLWQKWKLQKRARRIGLENLPASAQMRLARQLAFYDDLVKLLERHNITRPRHLTPMEFSDSITFLPTEVYDAVRRLTQIFYRIRYGNHQITHMQRMRLNKIINDVGHTLEKSPV